MSPFFLQVSAEPDGTSYVFQGFIQGKDYGQFGLQRLGKAVINKGTHKKHWIMNVFLLNLFG